jgi:hypothetical protein
MLSPFGEELNGNVMADSVCDVFLPFTGPGASVPVPLRVVQLLSTLLRGHPVQQSDVCSRALGLLAAVHRVLLASPPPIPPPSQRGEDEEDVDQSEAPSEVRVARSPAPVGSHAFGKAQTVFSWSSTHRTSTKDT